MPIYGARDGLADRLEDWIDRLGKDRSLPWAGSGLLADLQTAADVLKGRPAKAPAAEPEPEAWEIEAKQKMEFDL